MTKQSYRWKVLLRILAKTVLFFSACNLLFAWTEPLESLGRISLYNWLLPGRERLPYGENPAFSYNLSLDNIPAMMASHRVSQTKADDEFRVLIFGDSSTWGWLLENEGTLAGQLNRMGLEATDGRHARFYNLGYPIMALSKDLLLLDAAMTYEPDLIIWPVTLRSFPWKRQWRPPLVMNNEERFRSLEFEVDPGQAVFKDRGFWERTIIGQRRPLADLLRLQTYGFSWAATGIDQYYPAEFEPRTSNFDEDRSWGDFPEPIPLTGSELALDLVKAGVELAGPIPLLVVNEPIFISRGRNSHLRYNAWYPRWAYDAYRQLLAETAVANGWFFLDVWSAVPQQEFTDSPVHLTPAGVEQMAELIVQSGIRNNWFAPLSSVDNGKS